MELRTQELPSPDEWESARTVAGAMLGVKGAAYLTAPAVADFVAQASAEAAELARTAPDLVTALESVYRTLVIPDGERLQTARASAALVQRLPQLTGIKLVQTVASPELAGATPTAAGKSLASASAVAEALNRFPWHRLDPLREAMNGEDDRAASAAAVVHAVRDALQRDELVSGISSALAACEEGIFAWLSDARPKSDVVHEWHDDPRRVDPIERSGRVTRAGRGGNDTVITGLTSFLNAHPNDAVEVTWRVVP
jgi:hypothetical protein